MEFNPSGPAERLLDELEARRRERYGRQTEAAKILGGGRKRLNDRISPSLAVGLGIQQFLKTQKRSRKSGDKP